MYMNIFEYSDYRKYLKDTILDMKKTHKGYSFRSIAYKLGCNPGFFIKILKGERNLTPEFNLKLHSILKLQRKEKKYFELLVGLNQAKKQIEKEYYYNQLNEFRDSTIKKMGEKQYSLYNEWYTIALRELINMYPCFDTSEATAKKLSGYLIPVVKYTDIQKSLATLLELGILEKRSSGRLLLSDKLITTGQDIPTVIVQRILMQFFDLGKESIDRFEKRERVCSTVTVSISENGFEQIKTKLEQCRKEILEIAHADMEKLDRVYHMNIQLFPLSKQRKEVM